MKTLLYISLVIFLLGILSAAISYQRGVVAHKITPYLINPQSHE